MTAQDRVLELIGMVGDRVVVLHGPREEEGPSGRDVDCIVDGLDLRWPLRLPEDWRLCQSFHYDLRAWYWVLERRGEYVAIDTTDDPEGFCRDAVRTRSFLERLQGEPSPLLRAAYLTVKRVRKRMLDPAEWATIGMLASRDPSQFRAELEHVAGPTISSLLAPDAIAGVAPTQRVVRTADRLRWARRFGSYSRIVRAVFMGSLRYGKRICNPAGLYVLIVGPDGVGKSTLASLLPVACEPMFRRHAVSHWRPGILPRPGALVGRARSDPTKPHARDAFGRLPSALLLGYYWLDFLAGGVLRNVPMKIRSGLVVGERGWWDMAVDPKRYRLRIAPGWVRTLGWLLPRPDLVIVLEADPHVLQVRKPELEPQEIERQITAWRCALPAGVPSVRIDVSRPVDVVLAEAIEAITRVMESRAISGLDSGWAALPSRSVRWWLPRGPRGMARASVSVYQPVTGRGLVGWSAARGLAAVGGFRLLPSGPGPPRAVRRALASHVPQRGTLAVARATHEGRFIALLLEEGGRCRAVAKVVTDVAGVAALRSEEAALRRVKPILPRSLRAPRVVHCEPGLLILEPFEWTPRLRPWVLPEEVGQALGQLFHVGKRAAGDDFVGPAHGDCAPWNLLRTSSGWALVDWESAGEAPPFHDVCHYLVQSHALLGRPSASDLIAGFAQGRGAVGRAVRAYASTAKIPIDSAPDCLIQYLRQAVRDQTARTAAERRGLERRRRLLAQLQKGVRPPSRIVEAPRFGIERGEERGEKEEGEQ